MGILGRIGQKLKQGTAAALAPAVDPRATGLSAQQKQEALLAQVAAAIDDVTAARDRLEAGAAAVRARLPALEDEARRELRAGRRNLARLALQRRQVASAELRTLEGQLAEVEREEVALSTVQQRLAAQIDAFVARQEVIRARYSAAEAQVRINEAVTGVSADFADLTAALRRAEDQTQALQARAAAIDRLVQDGDLEALTATIGPDAPQLPPAEADLERQLAALEEDVRREGR
jgi:phage shock protein A